MKINRILCDKKISNIPLRKQSNFGINCGYCVQFKSIDRDFFVKKGLVRKSDDIRTCFEEISNYVFSDSKSDSECFKELLDKGKIALSSSIIKNYKNPSSAVGIVLNINDRDAKIFTLLMNKILQGKGIGINLSRFKDPVLVVKKMNSYFKYREKKAQRPPAGIALLNINHPKILDFITLKNNEEYKNWCFDLSVVVPSDFLKKVDDDEDIVLQDGNKLKARKIYSTLLDSMLKKGEPGIIFSDNKDYICDSCGAKELKENENLTISHINLSEFYDEKAKKPDYKEIKKAAFVLSKAMKKIDSNGCIGVVGYQELLDKLNFKYGSSEALKILEDCMKIIQEESHKNNVKTAISPTGTVSKYLNITPSVQPKNYGDITYEKQLNTLISAQKFVDCNISNTIILKSTDTTNDVDKIIRYASKNNLKGLTVFSG